MYYIVYKLIHFVNLISAFSKKNRSPFTQACSLMGGIRGLFRRRKNEGQQQPKPATAQASRRLSRGSASSSLPSSASRKPQTSAESGAEMACLLRADGWVPSSEDLCELKSSLQSADRKWIASFTANEGLDILAQCLLDISDNREEWERQEKHVDEGAGMDEFTVEELEKDLAVERLIVHCLMVLLNKEGGMVALGQAEKAMPCLAKAGFSSPSSYVRVSILRLFAVIAGSDRAGCDIVLAALEFVKLESKEDLRFTPLMSPLSEESASLKLKLSTVVLINAIMKSCGDAEERMFTRGEMVDAGILEAISSLDDQYRQLGGDSDSRARIYGEQEDSKGAAEVKNELAMQIDLFEALRTEVRAAKWQLNVL